MPILNSLRLFYLLQLSQPQSDRIILRTIHQKGVQSILELGMGTGERAKRMIELAKTPANEGDVRYIGIDPFEGRPDGQPLLTLKATYRELRATGAQVQLLPGEPLDALPRFANMLGQVDLLVISAPSNPQSLARAWFFMPRMLHDQSLVFLEERNSASALAIRQIPVSEIKALADRAMFSRRAA